MAQTRDSFQLSLGIDPPHNNQYLFSDHYLAHLLPADPRWAAARPEAEDFLRWLQGHYAAERGQLAGYKESQLEANWFEPILRRLGHTFERQASVPGLGAGIKVPDYVFFPDEAARQAAVRAQKTEEYAAGALAVGEVKAWDTPLGKKLKAGGPSFDNQNPSYQVDYYLKATGLDWGILSNGRHWRLVQRESSQRLTIYYEVDLVELLQRGRAEEMAYFTLFFRQTAFRPDAAGRVFLAGALAASNAYAVALEEDLKQNVYQALEWLMQGFLDLPANRLGAEELGRIYDNSLYLLYRLLFIFYAESRGLLPLGDEEYREHYSLRDIARDIANRNAPTAPMTTVFWNRLKTLFHIINGDDAALNRHLGVPRYNGGLFSPALHPFLEEKGVGDRALTAAIDLLARRQTPAGREFVDYRTLGERQLGSIYEGLLEYRPGYAGEAMVAVRDGKQERWRPAAAAPPQATITDRREAGQLYLETDKGERKATGSYYTPAYIVEYIVENTLGPLVEEVRGRVGDRGQVTGNRGRGARSVVEGILGLKTLDPAMGSGHFLVAATEYLAVALATDPTVEAESTPEEDVTYWKRQVVERCIYGVDKNPLAVELAKLSLWLATVAVGRPLSFLDHHLKCGDSLIGARVDDLGWAPPLVLGKKGQKQLAQQKAGQMNLFAYRLSQQLPAVMGRILEITGRESDSYETVQAKEAADVAVGQLKAPFEAVAHLWTSAYFGHDLTPAEYGEALDAIGKPPTLLAMPAVQRAQAIQRERNFLHWELAFPEVFYDGNGQPLGEAAGFDAVVGNPPYANAWAMTDLDPQTRSAIEIFRSNPQLLQGHWDLYVAFIDRAVDVSRRSGRHSFIVPDALAREKYALELRKYFLTEMTLRSLMHFEDINVFDEVSRHCLIYILENDTPEENSLTEIVQPTFTKTSVASVSKIAQSEWLQSEATQIRVRLADPSIRALLQKISSNSIKVGQFCYVMVGATTHAKDGSFTKADIVTNMPKGNAKRFFDGKNLSRYRIEWDGRYVDYRPNEMYGPRVPELFENAKVVVRDVTGANERLMVSFDDMGLYCDHLVTCVTYYDNVENAKVQTIFEGYDRVLPPYPALPYLTALLASNLMTWYFREVFATGTLQGSYSHTYPQQVRAFPIRRIDFTMLDAERQHLAEKGRKLYERFCQKDDFDCVLGFVEHHLGQEPEEADVVHDLLAFLAGQMMEMNREKQQVENDFWLDLEGAAEVFATLRSKGKQEASLWAVVAARPFVSQESRSTRTLDESLGWNEEAFKGFVKALAGPVGNLSGLVGVYRNYHVSFFGR
ncbi:MAG: N-6 DNA methylase [Chloroflexi bacterium]|nr:N-6 DNA methylase [Chloroflexota bacterium]